MATTLAPRAAREKGLVSRKAADPRLLLAATEPIVARSP